MSDKLFDIDEFSKLWSTGSLAHYFEKLNKASNSELSAFRRHVQWHRRQSQKITFATAVTPQGEQELSIHRVLLQAIDWKFIQRSKLRTWLHNILLPIRKWWVSFWKGADLIDTDHMGPVEVGRKSGKNFLHYVGMRQYLVLLGGEIFDYIVRHHWKIIMAVIAIAGIYASALSR